MEDYFSFLPKEGVFFIDTCAFSLSPYEDVSRSSVHKRKPLSVKEMKEEVCRLRFLNEKLSRMNNWLTIQEVIDEFQESDICLSSLMKRRVYHPLTSAIGELLDERKKAYKLLKQEHVNATENFTEKLEGKIKILLPQVTKNFTRFKGKINERNTDCKIISTALAYAESMPVGVFSNDCPLLMTFSYCASNSSTNLKETFVIEERFEKMIPTREYSKEHIHSSKYE